MSRDDVFGDLFSVPVRVRVTRQPRRPSTRCDDCDRRRQCEEIEESPGVTLNACAECRAIIIARKGA